MLIQRLGRGQKAVVVVWNRVALIVRYCTPVTYGHVSFAANLLQFDSASQCWTSRGLHGDFTRAVWNFRRAACDVTRAAVWLHQDCMGNLGGLNGTSQWLHWTSRGLNVTSRGLHWEFTKAAWDFTNVAWDFSRTAWGIYEGCMGTSESVSGAKWSLSAFFFSNCGLATEWNANARMYIFSNLVSS